MRPLLVWLYKRRLLPKPSEMHHRDVKRSLSLHLFSHLLNTASDTQKKAHIVIIPYVNIIPHAPHLKFTVVR